MKRYTPFIAASLLAVALSQVQTHAADNTWNNGSSDFLWNTTSLNWTSPTTWADGNDATFGATGVGTVTLGSAVTAHNVTINTAGYTIAGGGNALTLAGTTPTITANANSTIASIISGIDGLTVQGSSELRLWGDASAAAGNSFTGGTFVRSGTLLLQVSNLINGTTYAIDGIAALDAGATVRYFNGFDGVNNLRVPEGQIPVSDIANRLMNLTGGTLDFNGDDNQNRVPLASGTGTIRNGSPYSRAVLKMTGDGNTHTFSGSIMDGGPVTNSPVSGKLSHRMEVDFAAGSGTWILEGSNSFTGFVRLNGGQTIQLSGNGTLGYPASVFCPGRHILQNGGTLDLNGTSQKTGYYYSGNVGGATITNTAIGTLSILTVGFNCTNLTTFTNSGVSKGIQTDLQDDPATGGLIGLTKEGVCVQPIGLSGAGTAPINNYHGDTVVNNGTLLVFSAGAISPNSTYRLNTAGVLHLDYVGDALVRGLYINGVEMPAGTYSSSTAPITGTGTITVPPPNVWNNASADFLWNATSANWTSPTTWADGASAIFGATGAGTVTLGAPVSAHNINFTAPGYTLAGGGNALTIVDLGSAITANAGTSNYLGVSILGTSGLTFKGPGTTVLGGDAALGDANHYTGATYFRSGTVVLEAVGAGSGATAGDPHAVASIEALDTGATLKFGTTFDGAAPIANQWVSAPGEQIGARIPGTKMIMTGGTLDLNNDPKNEVVRVPDGSGLIINKGSSVQAGLNVIMDGLNHTFSGVIADGNNGVLTGDNFASGATPQGPGYQIGIVSISGTAGSTWTLAGDNTFSGSSRIDGSTTVKLAGNHSLGTPTLTGSLTGPLRIQNGSALDLNGRNQTLALMTAGQPGGKIYNSAVGTVSTLTVGYGMEQAGRNAPYQMMDNTGVGGKLAFRKIDTQPYALIQSNITTSVVTSNWVTTCVQGLRNDCVATYSGDTSVESGMLDVQGTGGISANSAYRINTTGAFGPGVLKLSYAGDAPCRQLWINGVQQPNGTYGAGTTGIDPTSTGTITVTGFATATLGVIQSGNNLNFSWAGVYKLQSSTNSVLGPYSDYVGAGLNAATVPINKSVGAVYFRLVTY